jgi:hypothetical protein
MKDLGLTQDTMPAFAFQLSNKKQLAYPQDEPINELKLSRFV